MRAAVVLLSPSLMQGRRGPDGRGVARARVTLASCLAEGALVEVDGDPLRWYHVVSCRPHGAPPVSPPAGIMLIRSYDLVLRESSPEERLAWEVMSS